MPDFVAGQLVPCVFQDSAYLDCICPLVSQLKWLLRISNIFVDVFGDKFTDRIDTAGKTVLFVMLVKIL